VVNCGFEPRTGQTKDYTIGICSFPITNFAGDVVTPGFFREFPTTEDIMYRPYGGGEMNMFNFAYNLITLKFKKANQQLPNDILRRTLKYMNIGKL
jgi:hypothetical protein